MAYDVGYKVDFRSGGDTVSEAFSKHISEITRIYGILNELKENDLTASELNTLKTGTINGSRVTGTIAGYVDGSHVTGNIAASQVSGKLTNATIASGNVTGLEAFVKGLLPREEESSSDKGDGITSSNLSADGYVKFNNGLIIQWGRTRIDIKIVSTVDITFPTAFTSACYSVIPILNTSHNSVFCTLYGSPTASSFSILVSQDASINMIGTYIHYLAIGV